MRWWARIGSGGGVVGAVVFVERRTLREAEERAEADAGSAVVSGARVVGSRRHEAFWAAVAARDAYRARAAYPFRRRS